MAHLTKPIAARKGRFVAPAGEIALQYRDASSRAAWAERDRDAIRADYQRHVAYHEVREQELKNDLARRTEWARKIEGDLEQRTEWALTLERDHKELLAEFEHVQKSEAEGWDRVALLARDLESSRAEAGQLRAQRERLEARWWWKVAKWVKGGGL